MKKLIYLFLFQFICINTSAFGQQKIVLLTSLDPQTISGLPFLRKKYITDLENIFRDRFSKSCFKTEIIRNADQADLWNALHDPKNVAVYWLSHVTANPENGLVEFLSCGEILDANGFDVSPIFSRVHPNLRVLGVVGCNSLKVLRNFDYPSSVEVFGFKAKIEAQKGLNSILYKSAEILESPEICKGYSSEYPEKQNGYSVLVKRFFSKPDGIRPAARIMAGDKVLGVFPKTTLGETYQISEFFIPQSLSSNTVLPNLRINLGNNPKAQKDYISLLDIGELNLTIIDKNLKNHPLWDLWDLFRAPSGQPMGVFLNIYKFQQNALFAPETLSSYLTEESEFCVEPMPPYCH